MEIKRNPISRVVGGGDDDTRAGFDAVAVEVGGGGAGEHDAGPIVVGKDERSLDRAGGEHHLLRPHLPQPLARQARIGIGEVIGQPLDQPEEIVREIAESGRADELADAAPVQGLGRFPDPALADLVVDGGVAAVEERPAKLRLLVAEDHAKACFGCGAGRG